MLGLGLSLGKSSFVGGVSFDSDYQAILNYASGEGHGVPSAAQQTAQNTLVTSLKGGANVWDELDGLYVFANNGSEQFALINWKNLTSSAEANAVSGIAWASDNGFTGDGSADYIDTNFVPSASSPVTKFQADSASVGMYTAQLINAANVDRHYPISFNDSSYRIRYLNQWNGANRLGVGAAGLANPNPPSVAAGLQGMMKSASAKNAGLDSSGSIVHERSAGSAAALTTNNLWFLRYAGNYSNANIKLGFVGGKFTSTQWGEFVAAVDTYAGTLSP